MSELRILTPNWVLLYRIDVKSIGRVTREPPEKFSLVRIASSVKTIALRLAKGEDWVVKGEHGNDKENGAKAIDEEMNRSQCTVNTIDTCYQNT
jgi:hypothetical protein